MHNVIKMSDYITTITLLQSPWNANLTTQDFMIETETPLRLRERKGAWVVLFYGEDEISKQTLTAWSKVSQNTIGPEFGSCNLRMETKLASRILDTYLTNPSLKWTNTLTVPYIISYYNEWPITKYTGPIDIASISNWALASYIVQDKTTITSTTSTPTTTAPAKEAEVKLPQSLDTKSTF